MNYQEYLEEILESAKEWINDNIDCYAKDDFDSAWEDLELCVTGNDNGSFYCNSAKAKEALSGVIFDERVVRACSDYGYGGIPTDMGPEACDVIVRCVLLQEVHAEIEEYWDESYVDIETVIDSMDHWLSYDKDHKKQEYPEIYDAIDTWRGMLEKIQERE